MKKSLFICICLSLSFLATGCSLGSMITEFLPEQEAAQEETAAVKTRVYIDEVTGILTDFDGTQLTLQTEDEGLVYTFDVSGATLECEDGMITGDVISVIYEGQLGGTDTSTVKALKVVDELRNAEPLATQTVQGALQTLTLNTITIQSADGITTQYTTTGAEQYFQNGIRPGSDVFITIKGSFAGQQTSKFVQDTSHIKVISVSDQKELTVPEPTKAPKTSEDGTKPQKSRKLHVVIQSIQNQTLQVLPEDSEKPLTIDTSAIPVYFKGGISEGSRAKVIYHGDFNGETLEGLTILGVTGENPDKLKERNITSSFSGIIIGVTTGTITLETADGATITCDTQNARNSSTQGLAIGASVRVTFNPSESKDSNIYHCLTIEDA